MTSTDLAFVFPGQGAQRPDMLDAVRHHPAFQSRLETICDAIGGDVERALRDDEAHADSNLLSSLLTVLVSSISLDEYRETRGETAGAMAGYSVGQWTAMYAAGCLSFESLVQVITTRGRFMDACFSETPGAMMAVIGVAPGHVEQFCERLRLEGHAIYLSNENCHGQYSLAGTVPAIDAALHRIVSLGPKKAIRLPTSGAWHCPLVAAAEGPFGAFLRGISLNAPGVRLISNVTGDWVPSDRDALTGDLVRHLSHPVRWSRGIQTLIAGGCHRFVELGYGNMLTKFGFFVDRSVSHTAFLRGH